jgi:hypothetical protein
VPNILNERIFSVNSTLKSLLAASFVLIGAVVLGLKSENLTSFTLILLVIAFFAIRVFADLLLDIAEEAIGAGLYFPKILINKGDKRNYEEFIRKRRLWNTVAGFIFATCITTIVLNVVAAIFYDQIVEYF